MVLPGMGSNEAAEVAEAIRSACHDEKVKTQSYDKGMDEAIVINGLSEFLKAGKQTVAIKFLGVEKPLPYTLSIGYHTTLPPSSKDCALHLATSINQTNIKTGQTVRLQATLTNTTDKAQPMPMAIIGLPAGLSAQPWQLKALVEQQKVDFYEVMGNQLVFYYQAIKPNQVHTLNLDLKAEISGTYKAPASYAYLYYTNEHKYWVGLGEVVVR